MIKQPEVIQEQLKSQYHWKNDMPIPPKPPTPPTGRVIAEGFDINPHYTRMILSTLLAVLFFIVSLLIR